MPLLKKTLLGLILGLIGCLAVLVMFYVPFSGGVKQNKAVVTADIKGLDNSLRQLKTLIDSGKTQAARVEFSALKEKWLGLDEGLVIRGLDSSSSSVAFRASMSEMETAITRDRETASKTLNALTVSMSRLKTDLAGTRVIDTSRLLITLSIFAVLWVGLVMAIHAISQRLALQH